MPMSNAGGAFDGDIFDISNDRSFVAADNLGTLGLSTKLVGISDHELVVDAITGGYIVKNGASGTATSGIQYGTTGGGITVHLTQ